MVEKRDRTFPFARGDVILAKYAKEIFYAKIVSVNNNTKFAMLLFDDNSQDEVEFHNIFSVNETTADIICVVCREDRTDINDDIVLCDVCSVGFHQKCHEPHISSDILVPEVPWQCHYCETKEQNTYVQGNPFEEKESRKNGRESKSHITLKATMKSEDISTDINITIKDVNAVAEVDVEETDELNKALCREKHYTTLNHIESSPFKIIINRKTQKNVEQTISNSLETEKSKCTHHDMNNSNLYETEETQDKGIIHCQHSDIFKKLLNKDVKVNRVSPWMQNDSDNLVMDLRDEKDRMTSRNAGLSLLEQRLTIKTHKEKLYKKSGDDKLDTAIVQSRFMKDLPRHNWLIERLKQQNKIVDEDISSCKNKFDAHEKVTEENTKSSEGSLKEPEDKQAKDKQESCEATENKFKNTSEHPEGGIKIVKVESLSENATNASDTSSNSTENIQSCPSSSKSISFTRSSSTGSPISQSRSEIQETVESFAHLSRTSFADEAIESRTTCAAYSQPKIISESPSKQYSIPSEKDLQTIRYNSLSSFKNVVTVKPMTEQAATKSNRESKRHSAHTLSPPKISSMSVSECSPRSQRHSPNRQRNVIVLSPPPKPSLNKSPNHSPRSNSTNTIQKNVMAMFQGNLAMQFPTSPNLPPSVAGIVQSNIAVFKKNLAVALKNDPNFIQNNPSIIPTMQKMYQLSPSQMSSIPGFVGPISPINGFPNAFSNTAFNTVPSTVPNDLPPLNSQTPNHSTSTFSMVRQPSPEDLHRRLKMQRQLQSQKEWINDHDTRNQLQSSPYDSDVKTLEGMKYRHINDIKEHTESPNDSVIDKRISILTNEIKDLQRHKELQNTHKRTSYDLRRDDLISTEERLRRLDRDLASKINPRGTIRYVDKPDAKYSDTYEPYSRVFRYPSPPGNTNGRDSEERDNLLLKQLQTKHDESDGQTRMKFEIKRLRELAELKKLCSEKYEPPSGRSQYEFDSPKTYQDRPYYNPMKRRYTSPERSMIESSKYRRLPTPYTSFNSPPATIRTSLPTTHNLSKPVESRMKSPDTPSSDVGRKKPCKKCGQSACFLCSVCRYVWYCSQECQLADWKIHARSCAKLKELNK